MNVNLKVPFAYSNTLNRYVDTDEVERGFKCNCICIGCGMSVKNRKGESYVHHFAHEKDADKPCEYSFWVSIRDIAKQVLLDTKYLQFNSTLTNNYRVPLTSSFKHIQIYHEIKKRDKEGMDLFLSASIGEIGIYFITQESGRERLEEQSYFSKNLFLMIDLCSVVNQKVYTIDYIREIVAHSPSKLSFKPYLTHKERESIKYNSSIYLQNTRLFHSKSIMDMNLFKGFGIKTILINSFTQNDISAINLSKIYYQTMNEYFKYTSNRAKFEELNRDRYHSFIRYENKYYATVFVMYKIYIYQIIKDSFVLLGVCRENDDIYTIIGSCVKKLNDEELVKAPLVDRYPKLFEV